RATSYELRATSYELPATTYRLLGRARSDHPLVRLLILQTELVDQLGVELNGLIHPDRPRLREDFWVVDGDLDFERAVVRPPNALGHLRGIAHRGAAQVHPQVVAKARRLNDQRVVLPTCGRVPHPAGCRILRQRPSVGED